jgi:C1A family cysteine protease
MDKKDFKGGWLKDLTDLRDFRLVAPKEVVEALPGSMDLRSSDTPILNQGSMGSCVAHAAIAVFQWLQKFKTKTFFVGSRMFIYKKARDYSGLTGDSGTYLRDGAKAMANFGVPPESLWAYNVTLLDVEPTAAVKAEAIKAHADSYWRLDGANTTETLNNIKSAMATNGLPVMFGTTVYDSIFNVGSDGLIPLPSGAPAGGHAMAAVGYDDAKSALLVKNSWGTSWGMSGYGWLPYYYVTSGLLADAWVVATESQIPAPGPTPDPLKATVLVLTAK